MGGNTPGIIKYPFWKLTVDHPDSCYVCLNLDDAFVPRALEARSICIARDIGEVLRDLAAVRTVP